jgi:hypothetical protein
MKVERGEPSRTEAKRSGKTGDAKLTLFSSSSSSFPWGIELNRIGLGADQDIDTNRVTVPELDFKSPFVLEPVSTSDSSPTKMRAFLTWFDTFFSPDASHEGQAPLERDTQYVKYEEDAYRRDVPVVSAKETGNEGEGQKKGKEVSFTTGPRGKATHWKQVAFMLKEPVEVPVGEFTDLSCGMNSGPARMGKSGGRVLSALFWDQAGWASDAMTMTKGEEEDEKWGRAVLRLQPFLSYARVKRNSGVNWASFLLPS